MGAHRKELPSHDGQKGTTAVLFGQRSRHHQVECAFADDYDECADYQVLLKDRSWYSCASDYASPKRFMKNGRCSEDCTGEHSDDRHKEQKQYCRAHHWSSTSKRRTETSYDKKCADKSRTKAGYKQEVKSFSNDE